MVGCKDKARMTTSISSKALKIMDKNTDKGFKGLLVKLRLLKNIRKPFYIILLFFEIFIL